MQDEQHHHGHPTLVPEVIDPVCGMTISPDKAAGTHSYKGNTYYFCSEGCLNKFKANPDRYLQTKTGSEQEFDGRPISCGLPEGDEFCPGRGHALGLQQQIPGFASLFPEVWLFTVRAEPVARIAGVCLSP